MNKKILMSVIMIIVFLGIWGFSRWIIDGLEVGPNPMHRFSPNYIMVRGHLMFYLTPTNYDKFEVPIDEYVESFFVIENWLIGKTEKGYFAINMQDQKVSYPLNSETELQKAINLPIERNKWVDSYEKRMSSKYLYRNPKIRKLGHIMNYVFAFFFLVMCAILVRWIVRGKKEHTPR